jgi:hypothetical protein
VQAARRDHYVAGEAAIHVGADRPALGTEVGPPGLAVRTTAANEEVRLGHDPIADLGVLDALPDVHDRTGNLVAERHGGHRAVLVEVDVEVGPADAGVRHFEHDLVWTGGRLRALDELDVTNASGGLHDGFHARQSRPAGHRARATPNGATAPPARWRLAEVAKRPRPGIPRASVLGMTK